MLQTVDELKKEKIKVVLFLSRDTDGGTLLDIFDEKLHPLSVRLVMSSISLFYKSILISTVVEPVFVCCLIFHVSRFAPGGRRLAQKSEVPLDYNQHDPEQKQIYRFVRTLFSAAQLTAECAIVTLVRPVAFPCVFVHVM